MSLSWEAGQCVEAITFTLRSDTAGWLGLGFTSNGLMTGDGGSPALMAFTFSGTTSASWFSLQSYSPSGVISAPPPPPYLPYAQLNSTGAENGEIFLVVTVGQLPAGTECPASPTEAVLCPGDTPTRLILAAHSNHDFVQHDRQASIELVISDGVVSAKKALPIDELIFVHALLMILAWVMLAPLGVAFKRFGASAATFKAHLFLQIGVAALTFVGIAVIVSQREGSNENSAHSIIGFVITGFVALQALSGLLRPKKPVDPADVPTSATETKDNVSADQVVVETIPAKGQKSTARVAFEIFHRTTGWFLLVLGIVNCILGSMKLRDQLADRDDSTGKQYASLIAVVSVAAVWIIVYIGLEVTKKGPEKRTNSTVPPFAAA